MPVCRAQKAKDSRPLDNSIRIYNLSPQIDLVLLLRKPLASLIQMDPTRTFWAANCRLTVGPPIVCYLVSVCGFGLEINQIKLAPVPSGHLFVCLAEEEPQDGLKKSLKTG